MPVTVGSNRQVISHKSSGGISIVFPDVCKTPAPAGPIPIPYPNIAQTATARQSAAKKETSGVSVQVKNTPASPASVKYLSAGPPQIVDVASNPTMEAQLLRARLSAVHQQVLNLPAYDPNQWQRLLEEYAVAASALYMTILPAD